jgi:hypothetical protein
MVKQRFATDGDSSAESKQKAVKRKRPISEVAITFDDEEEENASAVDDDDDDDEVDEEGSNHGGVQV